MAVNKAHRVRRSAIENVTVTINDTAVEKRETGNATVQSNGSAFEQIVKANRGLFVNIEASSRT
ncbi:hypothetical protein OS493_037033 [Desmophyllum pertusum]|uniref:Uncharacterized protein n=1 Tax=Desmophyllum pertusum TaxID=174260 RepID=A0A9W9Y789_9CNID|nr:hypothetical protein OS493_037033 [Desmophyllum pertusum]